ncbi:MAG: 2OG-Fe(II) oxygenase [Leptospiraceae bacterium]|nr:2OG-Fe(II) oxygenase [Leptospiraceae bacterium]
MQTLSFDGLEHLEDHGYFVADHVLSADQCSRLIRDFDRRREAGLFEDAGVGSSAEVQSKIRRSELIWLDPTLPPPAAQPVFDIVENLRLNLNRHYFLGLQECEAFYSVYRPGSYYRRHFDNFQGRNNRIITFIFYLNLEWEKSKGGALRFYFDPGRLVTDSHLDLQESFLDVDPIAGRLVVFYAPDWEHEVLPNHADRYCITGWLKRRAT